MEYIPGAYAAAGGLKGVYVCNAGGCSARAFRDDGVKMRPSCSRPTKAESEHRLEFAYR